MVRPDGGRRTLQSPSPAHSPRRVRSGWRQADSAGCSSCSRSSPSWRGMCLTHDSRRLFGRPLAAPWVANLPSLAGYVLVVAAIVVFVRARDQRAQPARVDRRIDRRSTGRSRRPGSSSMAPVAHRHTVLASTKFITLAYPVLDLVLAVSFVQFASALWLRRAPRLRFGRLGCPRTSRRRRSPQLGRVAPGSALGETWPVSLGASSSRC